MFAAAYNRREVVQFLLEKRADIHLRNRYGASALMQAAEREYAEVIRLLVDAGGAVLMLSSRNARGEPEYEIYGDRFVNCVTSKSSAP